jgi:hypothetical protein
LEANVPTLNNTSMRLADGALVVRPQRARALLGGMSNPDIYQLLNTGELESYTQGAARLITVESIVRYIARRVAASAPPAKAPCRPTPNKIPHPPSRPRTRQGAPTARSPPT